MKTYSQATRAKISISLITSPDICNHSEVLPASEIDGTAKKRRKFYKLINGLHLNTVDCVTNLNLNKLFKNLVSNFVVS